MSGILEEFPRGYIAQFGLGESSVDRYSRIRIVFSPFEEVFETMGTKIQWGLNRNERLAVRDLGQISGWRYFADFCIS